MRAFLLLIAIVPFDAARALDCVASSAELASALQQAGVSPADDEIRVTAGDYEVAQNLVLGPNFSPSGPLATGAVKLSGGWNIGCLTRLEGAQRTILRAGEKSLRFN